MSVNAAFSGLTGVALATGGWWLDERFGVGARILAALGVGLLGFAAELVRLLARPTALRSRAYVVIAADAAWVVAATVVIAMGDLLTTPGNLALAATTVVVAALALAQWVGVRRIGAGTVTGTTPVSIAASREIPADPARVWAAVADAGGYAAFADGIARTEIVGDPGASMVRVCTDDRGASWSERCTIWDPGRRYRMAVDVDSYPWHYRALLHTFAQTWEVEPTPAGTCVTLRFDGEVKLGFLGRVAIAAMGRGGRVEAILESYRDELTAVAQEIPRGHP